MTLYPPFTTCLEKVKRMSDGIGWGFHDHVAGVIEELDDDLGQQ